MAANPMFLHNSNHS